MPGRLFKRFKQFKQFIIDIYHAQRGIKSFTRCVTSEELSEFMSIRIADHFEIIIHCEQINYTCEFSTLWPKSKTMTVYRVYSTCSDNTPQTYKELFQLELNIPSPISCKASEVLQIRSAIDAYVTLIHSLPKPNNI